MAGGEKPAANHIASKTPEGNIEFDDRNMSAGAWGAKTKNGQNYLRGKCPSCGCKIWTFINSKEGWKLVKESTGDENEGEW